MSSVAKFHVNFSLSIIVFCMFLSNTLIMANPDISSMNGDSTFINLLVSILCVLFGRMVMIYLRS